MRGIMPLALAALVGNLLHGPVPAVAQQLRQGVKAKAAPSSRSPIAPYFRGRSAPSLRAALRAQISESEPNDQIPQANLVSLGDTISGAIDPALDADIFAVDLLQGTIIDFDVDAFEVGSPLDPVLLLFDVDSMTQIAANDDEAPGSNLDSRINRFTIPTNGRYFLALIEFSADSGGPAFTYTLKLGSHLPGPGDVTAQYSQVIGGPLGMTAADNGDLYVADNSGVRLVRVDPGGTVTEVADLSTTGGGPNIDVVRDVVWDGNGDLLVIGVQNLFEAVVWRVTTAGAVSVFASGTPSASFFGAITVDANGDVWVADNGLGEILHFDPGGNFVEAVDVSAILAGNAGIFGLAFSPAGELHFTKVVNAANLEAVYKLDAGNIPQVVIQAPAFIEGLAFDEDGYLYIANGFLGKVLLYDPNYQLVNDPFAISNMGGPLSIVFGRDGSGAMTSRLFVSNFGFGAWPPFAGSIVEMNPAGVRAPGWRIGTDLLRIVQTTLPDGTIGAPYMEILSVQNAAGPLTWSLVSGTLPTGLSFDTQTGVISGIPELEEELSFTIRVEDGASFGVRTYMILIATPALTVNQASDGLLGVAAALTVDLERFLDLQGNRNGSYDVGDFRAFLRAQGQLGTTTAAKKGGKQ